VGENPEGGGDEEGLKNEENALQENALVKGNGLKTKGAL